MTAVQDANVGPVLFIDPRQHGSRDEAIYTSWDLKGVETCDIVFGYLEKENPGGHGLALEFGFAIGMAHAGAQPKHIIYVQEDGHPAEKYLGMARACSDVVERTLENGIRQLLNALTSVELLN